MKTRGEFNKASARQKSLYLQHKCWRELASQEKLEEFNKNQRNKRPDSPFYFSFKSTGSIGNIYNNCLDFRYNCR